LADERLDRRVGFGGDEFGGEAAPVVDRREDGQAVLLAELVVVMTMSRCNVDEAGARVGGDEIGGEDLAGAIQERMLIGEADEVGAFPWAGDLSWFRKCKGS